MADTLKNKFSTEASANTSEAVSDTVAANEVDTILSISICNTHATTDTTIDLFIDPASGSNSYIYLNQALPAKSTFIHNSKIILKEGDVVYFQTSAAVNCQIVTSYLHQTAVATSSGNDYLDRYLIAQSGGSGGLLEMTPNNTTDVKTVLAFTVCNQSTTADTTFDVYTRNSSGNSFMIYDDQTLPSQSTFEHSDKIILAANEELVFDQAGTLDISVVTSFLRQVP